MKAQKTPYNRWFKKYRQQHKKDGWRFTSVYGPPDIIEKVLQYKKTLMAEFNASQEKIS